MNQAENSVNRAWFCRSAAGSVALRAQLPIGLQSIAKVTLGKKRAESTMQQATPAPLIRPALAQWRRLSAPWRIQIIGSGLFALLDLLVRIMVFHDPAVAFAMTLAMAPLLLLLIAGLGATYRLLGYAGRVDASALGAIAVLSLGAAALCVLAASALRTPFGLVLPYWPPGQEILVPLFYYATIFACWSLAYFWAEAELARRSERQRAALAEAEALRSELRRLRQQLDPHFLLNALNGIGEELHDDPAAASAMLRNLTQFLHHSLAGTEATVVTLGAELASLSAYLAVQQARFGPRLHMQITASPQAQACPIPGFLLQPLVENAVKHGDRSTRLAITLTATMQGDSLHITLINTGILGPRSPSGGIGLANLTRRLALHYPARHRFTLTDTPQGVTADLTLAGDPC